MAFLTWGSRYSIGIQTIDTQHKGLFDSLNDLHAAMMKGQGQELAGPILQRLVKYTHEHFAAEESMLAAAKYPQLDQHRINHRDFTKKVAEFVTRFERGEATSTVELLTFLRDWLAAHIQVEDSKYSPWMTERGMR